MRVQQSYAPFGSVCNRNKKIQKQVKDPGPGSYEINFPIITPIVQTIRKRNNNVIVKLGHLGTASFQNDQQRFKNRVDFNIGPGAYSPQKNVMDKNAKEMLSKHRINANQKVKQLIHNVPRRRAAISQVSQLQMTQFVQMPQLKKQIKVKRQNPVDNVRGSIWSKMTQQRSHNIRLKSLSSLGPGQYDPHQANNKDVPSAVFRSQSIRSFFDQIYFETNQDKLAKHRQENRYKSIGIGPGNYNLAENNNPSHKFQFFGSTAQRNLI